MMIQKNSEIEVIKKECSACTVSKRAERIVPFEHSWLLFVRDSVIVKIVGRSIAVKLLSMVSEARNDNAQFHFCRINKIISILAH